MTRNSFDQSSLQSLFFEQLVSTERIIALNDAIGAQLAMDPAASIQQIPGLRKATAVSRDWSAAAITKQPCSDRYSDPIVPQGPGLLKEVEEEVEHDLKLSASRLKEPLLRFCAPAMLRSAPAIMTASENGYQAPVRVDPDLSGVEDGPPGASPPDANVWRRTGSMFTAPDDAPRSLPSLSTMKEQVVETLSTKAFEVEQHMHPTGMTQAIARHVSFTNATLVLIFLNTIWIAVDTDYNKAEMLSDAPLVFQVVNNFFCFFFTLELIVRFFAFKNKLSAFMDTWFLFDAVLVAMMVWETWIEVALYLLLGGGVSLHTRASSVLRIFRMLRLTRVARVARLLHSCPELIILVEGMAMALRSVSCTFCLLVLVIYIYGVMFVQLLAGTDVGHGKFDNVPQAMIYLLLQVLCGFDADFIYRLLAEHWVYFCIYLTFLIIAGQTIMNMLIAVLCDVISNVAADEKEQAFVQDVEYEMLTMVRSLESADGDHFFHSGKIHKRRDASDTNVSKEEFHVLMEDPGMLRRLEGLGVDVVALLDFAYFVFRDRESLPLPEFMNMVIQFRGAKTCTVKDVVDVRKFVSMELSILEARLNGEDKSWSHTWED